MSLRSSRSDPSWEELRTRLTGSLAPRGGEAYRQLCASLHWNGRKVARYPDAVVHAATDADVQETVGFARSRGLKVAVRGGGHNWAGVPFREEGILLDLSRLNQLEVDPDGRLASVQPAATASDLVRALSPLGLAFPVGHHPTVPLGGYLLAGGFGWNSGVWGPGCMSVEGVEVVTADGESIHADRHRNADFFWAARGAGAGFFGVATRYHLRFHRLPRAIRTSSFIFALQDMERVVTALTDLQGSLRPDVELTCTLGTWPNREWGAERTLAVTATAFADSDDEARGWLRPLEDRLPEGAIHEDLHRETKLEYLLAESREAFPKGYRYAVDGAWTNAEPVDVFEGLRSASITAPSPDSFIRFALPVFAASDENQDVALSVVGRMFAAVYGIWREARSDGENIAWVAELASRLEPLATGYYVGESDLTASVDRPARCFTPAA